jgi:predicted ATPase
MLKRIYVHNYRTLVNFEWRPPPVCVLVGENGAGKSALVEAIWLVRRVVVEGAGYLETGFPATLTAWAQDRERSEQTIEVEVDHAGESFRYRLGCQLRDGKPSIREELSASTGLLYRSDAGKVELFGEPPSPSPRTTVAFDRRRSFISALEPRPENRSIMAFREAIHSIWSLKPDPQRLGADTEVEAVWLEPDLSNFASWYRSGVQEDPDAAVALRDDLKRGIVGFDQLRLKQISPDVKDLRVRFAFGGKDHELPWAQLSDGQRLLIALYGAFRFGFSQGGLVTLDEVENYVSPKEIQPWLRAVTDYMTEAGRQLLVISHHPEAINYMAADAAWRMWRDPTGGHSRIERLEPDLEAGETAYDLVKAVMDG